MNVIKARALSILVIGLVSSLLGSCSSAPACEADRLICQCVVPADLPRVIDIRSKNGELRSVDAYSMYMDHCVAGWAECLDRFMLGPDYLDLNGDSILAYTAPEIFIKARQDGFNAALQQIRCLVDKYGYSHAKFVVSRHILP